MAQYVEPWHYEFPHPATQFARKTERKTRMSKSRRLEEQLQRWQNAFAKLANTVRDTPGSRYPAVHTIASNTAPGVAFGMLTVAERFAEEARIDAVSRPELHATIDREAAIRVSAAVADAQRKHAQHVGELQAKHMATLDAAREKAHADGRREALAAVIEALELTQYQPRRIGHVFGDPTAVAYALPGGLIHLGFDPAAPTVASITRPNVDAFWSDLQTALRVRAEDAEAERDEAAADRIRAIMHPSPATTASDFHLAGEKLEDAA